MRETQKPLPEKRTLLAIAPARSLLLLFLTWLLCFIVCSVLLGFIMYKFPGSTKAMRISSVLQDIIVFIIPALVAAMLSTRLPDSLLAINRIPRPWTIFLGVATLIIAMPALNLIVATNMNLQLPPAMHGLETWMKNAEQGAAANIELVLGGAGIGNLIMSLLLVGVLAGFSEELFFRGALQRILAAGRINPHAAIWIAAFIFSAIHLQFYGFFPRLFLGAFFGYLLYWSGSLWLPIIAHIANNSLYVINRWNIINAGKTLPSEIPSIDMTTCLAGAVSATFTVIGLFLIYRSCKKPLF